MNKNSPGHFYYKKSKKWQTCKPDPDILWKYFRANFGELLKQFILLILHYTPTVRICAEKQKVR